MAKQKGKTLLALKRVNVSKLTEQTIQPYITAARKQIQSSVRTWSKKEYKSPAFYALVDMTGGRMKFNFKGADLNAKKHLLTQAISYLTMETRTVKGWEKVKKRNVKALNKRLGLKKDKKFTTDEYDKFYTAYEKLKELNPNVKNLAYKYDVFSTLLEELRADPEKSADELAVEMMEEVDNIIERKELQHLENLKNITNWS